MVYGQPHVIQQSQSKTASEYMYCLQWSRLVVEDARLANEDMNEDWDEQQQLCALVEAGICVTGVSVIKLDRQSVFLQLPPGQGRGFRSGCFLSLSRSDPCIDAWKHIIRVMGKTASGLQIAPETLLPSDICTGQWRLDLSTSTEEMSRLLSSIYWVSQSDTFWSRLLVCDRHPDVPAVLPSSCALQQSTLDKVGSVLKLNDEKRELLRKSLNQCTTLIQGPPGTGKSQFALGTIALHFLSDRVVLVATPSNTAADVLAVRCTHEPIPGLAQKFVRYGADDSVRPWARDRLYNYCPDHIAKERLRASGYQASNAWRDM